MSRCVIICGSPFSNPKFIKSRIQPKDFIVCADGGYNTVIDNGIKTNWLIGDFDSVTKIVEEKVKKIVLPEEKDYTDTMYCVKFAIREGYSDILLLGATGGRPDHAYANYAMLKYVNGVGGKAVLEDEGASVMYTESEITFSCNGANVSVLPYGCDRAVVDLEGFKYSGKEIDVTSTNTVGVSNIANADKSTVKVREGGVLIFITC